MPPSSPVPSACLPGGRREPCLLQAVQAVQARHSAPRAGKSTQPLLAQHTAQERGAARSPAAAAACVLSHAAACGRHPAAQEGAETGRPGVMARVLALPAAPAMAGHRFWRRCCSSSCAGHRHSAVRAPAAPVRAAPAFNSELRLPRHPLCAAMITLKRSAEGPAAWRGVCAAARRDLPAKTRSARRSPSHHALALSREPGVGDIRWVWCWCVCWWLL